MMWLPKELRDEMSMHARIALPNESGGVLMGYDAGNGVVVEAVIGPGPRALHEQAGFVPDYEFQQREISRVYETSGRRHTYLGDWHSHPGGRPMLSRKDKRTLRAIAKHRPARAPNPVMVILIGDEPCELAAWRCLPRRILRGQFRCRYERLEIVLRNKAGHPRGHLRKGRLCSATFGK